MCILNPNNQATYDCFADWYDEVMYLLDNKSFGDCPEDMALLEKIINRYLNNDFDKDNHWILELGCGTGRLSIPLLNAGYKIASVEFSRSMLSKLKNKLPNQKDINKNMFIVNSDLKQVDGTYFGDRRIKLIISPWSFLHSFSKGEQDDILNRLYDILDDGGILVDIDAHQIFWAKKDLVETPDVNESSLSNRLIRKKRPVKLGPPKDSVFRLNDTFYFKKDMLPSIIQVRTFLRNGEIIGSEKYLVQPPYDFVLQLQKAAFNTIDVLNDKLDPFVFHQGMAKKAEGIIYIGKKMQSKNSI